MKSYKTSGFSVRIIALLAGFAFLGGILLTLNDSSDIRSKASSLLAPSSTYNELPQSLVGTMNEGQWQFAISDENAHVSDWNIVGEEPAPPESQVFWKRLTHTQGGKSWTIKVGKGGQLYSMSMPQTGELIARQRVSHGQWIDEVFQHTIPSEKHNHTKDPSFVDGDIHQAGYYTKSDFDPKLKIIPRSVYSPVFLPLLGEFINAPNSFSYITWPQHAHLPRTYTENGMLMHENIRDVGDGVVEISLLIDKWAGEETKSISMPWSAFRTENVPTQIISKPNGSYEVASQVFSDGKPMRLVNNDTGGWMAFTQSTKKDAYGIGIVFGSYVPGLEATTSYARWGTYASGTVATVKRDITLKAGDSVFVRYYLVFGTLSDIQLQANALVSKVQIGRIDTKAQKAGNVRICPQGDDNLRRGCPDESKLLFYVDRYHTENTVPLFLLGNTKNGKRVLSTNPYSISKDPTDAVTEYVNFIGWVPKSGRQCGANIHVLLLANGLGIGTDTTLNGMKARTNSTQCQ